MESIYEALPRTFNVAQHYIEENLAAGRAARVAFHHAGGASTYADTSASVRAMAGLYQELGLDGEQRVALLLPDGLDLVHAFLGAIWMGAVPVPINLAYSPADIRYIIEDCRAKILVTDRENAARIAPVGSGYLRAPLVVDEGEGLAARLRSARPAAAAPTCKDEPALWLYTSGSTGRPKGVIHAHHDVVVCAELYGKGTLGLREDDVTYSVAKIPFAYGLGNSVYLPMAVGASAVLSSAANAFQIIRDLEAHRPTVFFGIPAIYAALLAVREVRPLDASSVRLFVSAAEQLPETIWAGWRDVFGKEICEGIGTTELLHIFLSNAPGACRPGTSGRPVPGYDVRIVGEDGREVGSGEIGALVVRGESLMLGYWNRHMATREALQGEAMFTGDRYVRDADGYHRFMGRGDDLFKVSGMWVSPLEVEDVLLGHPAVLECAAFPALRGGLAQVVACVSLKEGIAPTQEVADGIRAHARSRLPSFKSPRRVRIVAELPRTATGKIDRKRVRALDEERSHETTQDQ